MLFRSRVPLPAGVSLTRDMNVWTTARSAWLQTHRPLTLDPGEVISLLTGDGDDQPTRFYWGSATPIWDNRGERATLRDPAGDVIDHCTYDGGVTSEAC